MAITFDEANLAQKLLLIDIMKNHAKAFAELADDCQAISQLITNRGWSSITDADVAHLGLTAAKVDAYVKFIAQVNKLMTLTSTNLALTTTSGRAAVDGIRNL